MHLWNKASLRVKFLKVSQKVFYQHRYVVSLVRISNWGKHVVNDGQELQKVFPVTVTLRD